LVSSEIAQCFGDNATGYSMEFRFRRIKADAKAIKAARAKGIDPMTLDMDSGLCKGTEGPEGLQDFRTVFLKFLSHDSNHIIIPLLF
jgi:hypothetical protein